MTYTCRCAQQYLLEKIFHNRQKKRSSYDHLSSTNSVGSLQALDPSLDHFINVLAWQVEQAFKHPFFVLVVITTVRVEDSGIYHLGKTNAIAFPIYP